MEHTFINILKRCIIDPAYLLNRLAPFLRGTFCIIYYRTFKRNVKIGFPFMVGAKIRIIGPGKVYIGKRCAVLENVFKGLTIVTFSKDSTVIIGNKCALGGITIRCHSKIILGDRVMTAVSLIQDAFFTDLDKDIKRPIRSFAYEAKPVYIGNNVWLGADSLVLGGSVVSNDCVVGAGSVCFNVEFKEYSLIIGNPACKSLPIDKLLRLKGVL